jgi:hypothetical protein
VSRPFRPREQTRAERQQLTAELAELGEMLPDPEDGPHYLAAVQRVMERWGQVPPQRPRRTSRRT